MACSTFWRTTFSCATACGLFVLISGCLYSSTPPRVYPPKINASAAGAKAVEMYDTNKDGKISGDEFKKCPSLKVTADKTKADITAESITKKIEAWQATRIGRTQFSCVIQRNGRPLADAEVTFVPEPFLGEYIKPASGKTDDNGMVFPIISAKEAGLALGWYRVIVSKPGLNIPDKYSKSETSEFGVEVGNDMGYARTPMFDMKF